MGDVHAEHAPEALMDPTDPWGTLGAHVVEAKGARGARVGGGVSVRSLRPRKLAFARLQASRLLVAFSHANLHALFSRSATRGRT